MENKRNILLAALVPGVIMALIAVFTEWLPVDSWVKGIVVLGVYGISILLIQLIYLLGTGSAKSYYDLWNIGKIRGLWQDKGLIKQIEKNFYSSQNIKIKVTRGSELLKPEQKYGLTKELQALKDGKGKTHDLPVNIQILLVIPCYQEEHVRERRGVHQTLSDEDFLKSWYKFLEDIRDYESDNLSINVKFYFSSHARWRFYIFEKAKENKNTCVLLSEYDAEHGGPDKPMYRIVRGENNIAGFMCKYFDELWNHKSTFSPGKLYTYIQTGKCQSHFCQNCNLQGDKNCTNCRRKKCKFESTCKEFTSRYKKVLESFEAEGIG